MRTDHLLSDKQKLKWKQTLKASCINIIQEKINTAQHAMQEAQESANNEDKSSAGDKHETSRAMSQLDRDMFAKQLEEAKRELQIINRLNCEAIYQHAVPGAVVLCENFSFFISLGLGTTVIDGHKVFLLSPKAPIAQLLNQKKAKDQFVFGGKEIEITDVF